jgi:cation transporter-like permease
VFREGKECFQVFRRRDEFLVFLIELDVTCLVVLGVKWVASFYKIKAIRLIINPDLTVTKPTDNRL